MESNYFDSTGMQIYLMPVLFEEELPNLIMLAIGWGPADYSSSKYCLNVMKVSTCIYSDNGVKIYTIFDYVCLRHLQMHYPCTNCFRSIPLILLILQHRKIGSSRLFTLFICLYTSIKFSFNLLCFRESAPPSLISWFWQLPCKPPLQNLQNIVISYGTWCSM